MSREEKIKLLIEFIWEVEGAVVPADHFKDMPDDELDAEIEWYEYLLTK